MAINGGVIFHSKTIHIHQHIITSIHIHYLILSLYTHTYLAINSEAKESKRKALKQGEEGFPKQDFGKKEVFDSLNGVIASFISFLLLLPIFVMDLSMRE